MNLYSGYPDLTSDLKRLARTDAASTGHFAWRARAVLMTSSSFCSPGRVGKRHMSAGCLHVTGKDVM